MQPNRNYVSAAWQKDRLIFLSRNFLSRHVCYQNSIITFCWLFSFLNRSGKTFSVILNKDEEREEKLLFMGDLTLLQHLPDLLYVGGAPKSSVVIFIFIIELLHEHRLKGGTPKSWEKRGVLCFQFLRLCIGLFFCCCDLKNVHEIKKWQCPYKIFCYLILVIYWPSLRTNVPPPSIYTICMHKIMTHETLIFVFQGLSGMRNEPFFYILNNISHTPTSNLLVRV